MTTIIKSRIQCVRKNTKHIIFSAVIIICIVLLIIYPKTVSLGIKNGINCCLNILVPSMFPFMVITSVIFLSGIHNNLNSAFNKTSKFLFYLPLCAVPAIFMSLIGGYPIGAYCVKSLYERRSIDEEQMNRMMCFCVNFGPAFIISALGQTLLNSRELGIVLFLIQVFSSLLIGFVLGLAARIKKTDFYCNDNYNSQENNMKLSQILIDACDNSCKSLLGMCSLITLFFGIISIINEIGAIKYTSNILSEINIPEYISNTVILSLLEMTQSCIISAKNTFMPYHVYSWIIGFGGLCAHAQIMVQLKNCPFKYKKFLIMRIINGLLTSAVTALLIKNPEKTLQTFAQMETLQSIKISKASPTHFGSIILLIFCVFFTFSVNTFNPPSQIRQINQKNH